MPGLLVIWPEECPMAGAVLVRPNVLEVTTRQEHLHLLSERIAWLLKMEEEPDEAALEASRTLAEAGLLETPENATNLPRAIRSSLAIAERLDSLGAELPMKLNPRRTVQAPMLEAIRQQPLEDWVSHLIP
jgi:hypothetical protein